MAKRPNQRLKLLYLAKIMLRLTDDEHGLQVEQIINELAKYDIAAERKSIYSDLEALQLFGMLRNFKKRTKMDKIFEEIEENQCSD